MGNIDWEELRNMVLALAAAITVVGIAWAVASYNMDVNAKIDAAVKSGVHPIDAACSFSGSSTNTCVIRAAAKGESK